MAHFAKLNPNNIVEQVIVVNNDIILDENGLENEELGINFCKNLFGQSTVWKQTSYNNSFRKNYAGIGYTYDAIRDAFIPPKPYNSWILNEETCIWDPPTPRPVDDTGYLWDDISETWKPC